MVGREATRGDGVAGGDGEGVEIVRREGVEEVVGGVEPAGGLLDGDLPGRGGGDDDLGQPEPGSQNGAMCRCATPVGSL